MAEAADHLLTKYPLVLNSREAILALAPLLEDVAARCGQPGAMHWLAYFLDSAVLRRRIPRLVLFLRPEEHQGKSLCADDIHAAALMFEYKVFGRCTGVIATADAVGFNTIVAPSQHRSLVAAAASRVLLEHGADVLLATYADENRLEVRPVLSGDLRLRWATRTRPVGRMLSLLPTLDETLAQMGKTTRWNLRYYRRRLEKATPCEFVADAAPLLAEGDWEALNQGSLNPVSADEFARRLRSATHLPGSFLCGLRSAEGQWLSLIGGWRQGDTTVLHWQMNSAGYEKHSLGTVMRSFFLEDEIARGSRQLLIYGGTPHGMRSAFQEDTIADLVVRREGLRGLAICGAAKALLGMGLLGKGNHVAEMLATPDLEWHPVRPKQAALPLGLKPVRAQRMA